MCVPQPQLLPRDSQPTPADGGTAWFYFHCQAWEYSGRRHLPQISIFELVISDVDQESQLVGLCTYPALLVDLPFYAGKTKLKFTTCFGTRLGIYCGERVDYITESSCTPLLPAF